MGHGGYGVSFPFPRTPSAQRPTPTLMALVMKIVSDLTYTFVDPRIDFERRG